MTQTDTQKTLGAAQRVVIKIGSVLIVEKGQPRRAWLEALAQDVADMKARGIEVLIVSSGAVALGRSAVGISGDIAPKAIKLAQKQAASAVGQFHLFAAYYEAFLHKNLNAAQILFTMGETENRRMYLNARGAVQTLLERGIVPIFNENDVISIGELRFGDNDRLAVRVAQMVEADAVVLLSTVDGLYTADPVKDPTARHIPLVEAITDDHKAMAADAAAGLSTGGMKSKMTAALSATRAGIALAIADGRAEHSLAHLLDGTVRSTLFMPQDNLLDARRKWLQAHLRPRGVITIDVGAVKALLQGGSLLPIGVVGVEGHFREGDAVDIKGPDGTRLGIGLIGYGHVESAIIARHKSPEIPALLGYAGPDALIHRNDMVLEHA